MLRLGKIILLILLIGSLVPTASAEIPRLIHYQGRMIDKESGRPADGLYVMKFTLYDEPGGHQMAGHLRRGSGQQPGINK